MAQRGAVARRRAQAARAGPRLIPAAGARVIRRARAAARRTAPDVVDDAEQMLV